MSDVVLFRDLQKKESVFGGSKELSVPTADLFQFVFIITERIAGVTARVSNLSLSVLSRKNCDTLLTL